MTYEDIIALYIFESNCIESERFLTYDQILEQVRSKAIDGHVGAWHLFAAAADQNRLPTRPEMFEAHHLLLTEQLKHHDDPEMADDLRGQIGCWRTCEVGVGDPPRACPPAVIVPSEMDILMRWCDAVFPGNADGRLVREGIGNAHYNFLRIHPFADGNGRMSRLYANVTARLCGVPPIIFTSADKNERYYPACQAETPALMREYVRENLETYTSA